MFTRRLAHYSNQPIIADDCTSSNFNFDSLQDAIAGAAHLRPRARHFSLSRCFFAANKKVRKTFRVSESFI